MSLTLVVLPGIHLTTRPKVLGGTWSGFHCFHQFDLCRLPRELSTELFLDFRERERIERNKGEKDMREREKEEQHFACHGR